MRVNLLTLSRNNSTSYKKKNTPPAHVHGGRWL